jgi:hypothetical protein
LISPILWAGLLLGAAARASDPASAVRAVPLSLGPGHRVVGPLTFERRKAAQGGYVFAAPAIGPQDEDAVRFSQAVVTAGQGPLGSAGRLSRRHGVPALSLPAASWSAGALLVPKPVLGPPQAVDGAQVRLVERVETRRLVEGEAVAVDPRGALLPLEPAEQAFELELAAALRAFDGLRDLQALLQWYDGRSDGGRPSPVLAARLVDELAMRLASGTAAPAEFARLRRALDAGLDEPGRRAVAESALRGARREIDDLAQRVSELSAEPKRASAAARALAASVGQPALAAPVEAAAKAVKGASSAAADPKRAAKALAAAFGSADAQQRGARQAAGDLEAHGASRIARRLGEHL